jgi:tetratricopeptide (TPR) repeat protein
VKPPEPKWWKTTPGHLTLWALQRDRTAGDLVAAEEAREFLNAATQASPLQACVRFALARQRTGPGGAGGPATSLALSRDVVALAWTGHQLLAAGKKEAALRAYRTALEMVAGVELARLALPAFNGDRQVRRYALPAEDLIEPIVRDLAEHAGGAYAEWSAALPPYAVVQLAAARVLRDRSSAEAEAVIEAILGGADAPPPADTPAAVHIAAVAEALALKGRWEEAQRRYRRAIELMPDPSIRRSWWMNLAEIALRLSDESGRQKALEAARGNDPNDEITRRAVEQLKYFGVRTERFGGSTGQDLTSNGIR